MRRLEGLTSYLRASGEPWVVLTLHEIERILGAPLPPSARRHAAFWSNSDKNAYSKAWRAAGYHVSRAGLGGDRIGFQRVGRPMPVQRASREPVTADVILLGCVATKRAQPMPARDLYVSPLFERRRAYAGASTKPWLILSALYGAVEPESVIDPYDVSLKEASMAERREWALQVLAQLREHLGAVAGMTFELHAGDEYAYPLSGFLAAAGAQVARPLKGLRIGEQLRWYDERAGKAQALASQSKADREVPRNADRPSPGLARAITEAFVNGELDFSARPGAPPPGWASMPEVIASEALRENGAGDAEVRLFVTFISGMDRARDADRLWFAGRDLFLKEPWVYDPIEVISRSFTELGDVLMTHRVSQRHLPDSGAWRRIAESLADRDAAPAIYRAVYEGEGDAKQLLEELDAVTPAGSRLLPFLSGPKIGPMWVRILAYPGGARISSLDSLPVAVDVQVRKVTEFLGLTDTYGKQLESVRREIQDAWHRDVAAHGATGPEPLTGKCAAVDPAIWFYGKWGCTICVAARRQIPIADACHGCRMAALIQEA